MPPAAAYGISPVRCASTEAVAQGFEVRACIEGRFDDSNGKVFLDKEERPELTVIAGGATIVPGLDDEIMGMKVGDKKDFVVRALPKVAHLNPAHMFCRSALRRALASTTPLELRTLRRTSCPTDARSALFSELARTARQRLSKRSAKPMPSLT